MAQPEACVVSAGACLFYYLQRRVQTGTQPQTQTPTGDRCTEVRSACEEKCWEEIPKDRGLGGSDTPGLLPKCVRQCMASEGCTIIELMISDGKTAEQISELMLDVFDRLERSIPIVKEASSGDEGMSYEKAVGKVACRIVFDILEPLYEKHPRLKPNNWDE